ncbi:MAG: HAMP domain-containing protein [Alphaproteobacteria bacterium]|nr:HAMP domain-containing protein [Alphaproteobacteria bacterium]
MAIGLTLASLAAGIATYAAMTETTPFGTDPTTITLLLTLDLVLLLLLSALVFHRILGIFATRRRNQAGSRLHVRMVTVFTLLAVLPSLIVASFAAVFFYFGVQAWFSDRVRTAINESLVVAQSYLKEHQQVIRADVLAMANDLNREALRIGDTPSRFSQLVTAQAAIRSLTEAVVFDGTGRILARSGLTFSLSFEPITEDMMQRARKGDVVLVVSDNDDRIRALVRLENFVDAYLFVGRLVDPDVLAHMATTQDAVREYAQLEGKRSGLQITITMIFIVVALLLLMAAVWFGLNFATRLVKPISELIGASERVRAGDLTTRVSESDDDESDDEISILSRSFNRMTGQLDTQRKELIQANRLIDSRRRFTEAVLATVPAGVIGLDQQGNITLTNISAAEFFKIDAPKENEGKHISAIIPEMEELMDNLSPTARITDGQIELRRPGQPARTMLVRIAADIQDNETRGYVVTFDDVSDLVSAQRKAAWADVARRIAHEIKNPLTPIRLSAERLRRKYAAEVTSDPETFVSCTDTIIRQVDDIGNMVDEFSAFARMPSPIMKSQDLRDLCRDAVFMQSTGRTDIEFVQEMPARPVRLDIDGRQVSQALTNIIKNAMEAIEGRKAEEGQPLPMGRVTVRLEADETFATVTVADNGKGLPVEERNRLTEPYVTTRSKGTGLGLAIVKKIMEDHRGTLTLSDSEAGGAVVTLSFARVETDTKKNLLARMEEIGHTDEDQLILHDTPPASKQATGG